MLSEALAAFGAGLVGAMATDTWQSTRDSAVRLFSRFGRKSDMERRLDEDAVAAAQDTDVRPDLMLRWQHEIETLLLEHPEAKPEVLELMRQFHLSGTNIQVNSASGNGTVYAVQNGTQEIHHPP